MSCRDWSTAWPNLPKFDRAHDSLARHREHTNMGHVSAAEQADAATGAAPRAISSIPPVARTGLGGPEGPFGALRNSTVMMVDDDPLMIEVVQTFLEEAGYTQFVTTSKPVEAFGLIAQHQPDILLLDLMMPEVTGFQILQALREHEHLRYTPVIILTAESDPDARLKALELGATDFLTKPVDPSELRLRLRNALAFKAYQDRLADFDALTGLLNRGKFRDEVNRAVGLAQQTARACAVLLLDLDR